MAAAADAPALPRRRVLVVDDSRSVQEAVRHALADMPHVVVETCGDVNAAEVLLSRMQPDLILCDVVLPGRPGYELCSRITRERQGRHPLIYLLSGAFEPFDADQARAAGADAVISKPFSPDELRERLESALAPAARVGADDGSAGDDITPSDLLHEQPEKLGRPAAPVSALDELAQRLEQPLAARLLEPLAAELARRLADPEGPMAAPAARALREAAERLVAEHLRRLEDEAERSHPGAD